MIGQLTAEVDASDSAAHCPLRGIAGGAGSPGGLAPVGDSFALARKWIGSIPAFQAEIIVARPDLVIVVEVTSGVVSNAVIANRCVATGDGPVARAA